MPRPRHLVFGLFAFSLSSDQEGRIVDEVEQVITFRSRTSGDLVAEVRFNQLDGCRLRHPHNSCAGNALQIEDCLPGALAPHRRARMKDVMPGVAGLSLIVGRGRLPLGGRLDGGLTQTGSIEEQAGRLPRSTGRQKGRVRADPRAGNPDDGGAKGHLVVVDDWHLLVQPPHPSRQLPPRPGLRRQRSPRGRCPTSDRGWRPSSQPTPPTRAVIGAQHPRTQSNVA